MEFRLDEGEPQKLTDWKAEPDLQKLKRDVEQAKPSHDAHVRRVSHWTDLMNVTGTAKIKAVPGRSSVQPKLIRRQAEWRYSALTEPFLSSDQLFKVKPITFEDTKGAEQNQMVLNHQFRNKIDRVQFIDNYVRATVDEGTSIVRLGWKRVTVEVDEEVPVYSYYEIRTQEQLQALQQAIEAKSTNPRDFDENAPPEMRAAIDYYVETETPVYAVQTGTSTIKVEKILENKPTLEIVNINNFYLDPSCGDDISKANFAVVTFETSKAELLKEPDRYKNLNRVNWETNTPLTETEHFSTTPDTFNFADILRKRVVAYEYWGFQDITGDGTLTPIVATWIGDTLIRLELNPFPDGKLPFVLVPYLPRKRDVWGEPDAELLEDNQKILGALTRGMIDLLGRSANGQQGMAKGMLDPINKRRFENGQDYEFNPNTNPNNGLIEHKYPELPQSAILMLNLQNQEAEALTGVKSFGGGISGEAYGDVAAGIRGVLDAASKREMAILRRLAAGLKEIGTKISSMNGEFLSETEIVRITNEEFVEVAREDLKGNFDFEVDISTAEVDEKKAQDLGFMLQTLGNTVDTSITLLILSEIAKLKRMPDLAKRLEFWKPPVDPVQEKLKELEVQKLELENLELQSRINLNNAKASEAEANRDKKNLEYVEQETGTTHAREMDKTRGQAQGNQDLQVTKALTAPRKEGEREPDIEAAIGWNQMSDAMKDPTRPDPTQIGVDNTVLRDELAQEDPRFSIGSRFYDPSLDPAANPNLNL